MKSSYLLQGVLNMDNLKELVNVLEISEVAEALEETTEGIMVLARNETN